MSPKTGFPYYQTDTDRYQDIKIKRLKKEYGGLGIAIYDYLLCEIYRDKGFYVEFDENRLFDVSEYWNLSEEKIKEITTFCCQINLFHSGLFDQKNILTSRSIQERFIEISVRCKRKNVKIPEEMAIIPEKTPILPEKQPEIPEEIDKVKYSKVKERKEDERKGVPEKNSSPPPTAFFKVDLDSFEPIVEQAKADQLFYEPILMKHRIDYDKFKMLTTEYIAEQRQFKHPGWQGESDLRRHIASWIQKSLLNSNNGNNNRNKGSNGSSRTTLEEFESF